MGKKGRKPSFPSPSPYFHFLALVSFLARPKPRIPFLGLSLLRNQTETLATQARLHLGDLTLLLMAISCLLFKVCLAVANCVISIIHHQMCYSWYNEVKEKEKNRLLQEKSQKVCLFHVVALLSNDPLCSRNRFVFITYCVK